jgi:hypothetical protein
VITCQSFYDAGIVMCCDSCHDDWDGGYDEPMELHHVDARLDEPPLARVCCTIHAILLKVWEDVR